MKRNVGGIDGAGRIIVGLALIAGVLTGAIGMWGWIGVVLVLTGVVRVCPLYSILGLNTRLADGRS